MRKQAILNFIEGAMTVYLEKEHTEKEAFEFAVITAIKHFKRQPLYRTEILELEKQYKIHGAEKMNLT